MALMQLPDIDLKNPEQLGERLFLFFKLHEEHDLKPTVANLTLALNNIDRRRLCEIVNGKSPKGGMYDLPKECTDLLKKVYKIMENIYI